MSSSRQTSRKRHARNPSATRTPRTANAAVAMASDYESDAPQHYYPIPSAAPANASTRSNTELNLSVLQRYVPSITRIMHLAVHAVVYTFASDTAQWDKTGIEGTMFACAQDDPSGTGPGRACIFILNKKGLDNVVLDMGRVTALEAGEELMSLRLLDETGGEPKVLGLWINKDPEGTRRVMGEVVTGLWEEFGTRGEDDQGGVEGSGGVVAEGGGGSGQGGQGGQGGQEKEGVAMQAMGRKLSLTDLFGRVA